MHRSKEKARTRLTALAFIVLAGAGIGLTIHLREAHGHSHDHAHASPDAAALTPMHGRRWETDQPLRTGMERIRTAAARVSAPGQAPLTKDEANKIAASIQEAVNYLIQNCKLEPKADAALHLVITDLMTGAAELVKVPSSAEGAALITRSLQRYAEQFDHPGWNHAAAAEPRG